MSNLLSRYAEAAYWLGRYVERAESLARIIDVNDTFSRNSRGIANWDAVLQLYGDEDNYRRRHGEPTAEGVVFFYLFDRENPGSVVSSVAFARDNARTLRPMISSEVWEQLNTFSNEVGKLDPGTVKSPGVYRLCNFIKARCQMHSGVVEATMYRDEAWYFHRLGKLLERGAQTAHYLDVRYRDLHPAGADDGNGIDLAQWMALLRSQAALHGYRRVNPAGISPRRVAAFLLFNPHFPRSVRTCVAELSETFARLRREFGLTSGDESEQRLTELAQRCRQQDINTVIADGLHEYLDQTQVALYALSDGIHEDFFGRAAA